MVLPVTGYLVMIHHQEAGTFAPAFRTLDDAEEFSNALRLVTDGLAISEPVPLVPAMTGPVVTDSTLCNY